MGVPNGLPGVLNNYSVQQSGNPLRWNVNVMNSGLSNYGNCVERLGSVPPQTGMTVYVEQYPTIGFAIVAIDTTFFGHVTIAPTGAQYGMTQTGGLWSFKDSNNSYTTNEVIFPRYNPTEVYVPFNQPAVTGLPYQWPSGSNSTLIPGGAWTYQAGGSTYTYPTSAVAEFGGASIPQTGAYNATMLTPGMSGIQDTATGGLVG